jgi:hypothetical protein
LGRKKKREEGGWEDKEEQVDAVVQKEKRGRERVRRRWPRLLSLSREVTLQA